MKIATLVIYLICTSVLSANSTPSRWMIELSKHVNNMHCTITKYNKDWFLINASGKHDGTKMWIADGLKSISILKTAIKESDSYATKKWKEACGLVTENEAERLLRL